MNKQQQMDELRDEVDDLRNLLRQWVEQWDTIRGKVGEAQAYDIDQLAEWTREALEQGADDDAD